MHIQRLQIQCLRSLDDVRIAPVPGLNLLVGPNGAGKSSVLEAVYLLSHGRSFRSGARSALIQRGQDALTIYAELDAGPGKQHRLGLGRRAGRWHIRIDGEDGSSLGDLVAHCAVICFEPGSHALIAGPAEERRRFLDWGVFHVEHEFLQHWRRYQRALRQRNALLRDAGRMPAPEVFLPWEQEMCRAGTRVETARREYLEDLRPHLEQSLGELLPELGTPHLEYRRGWTDALDFDAALAERRERDSMRGHTGAGPHRADWGLHFVHAPMREHLSRGQEKLCALGCLLAQARLYADLHDDWPIICFDDLASELDRSHQDALVAVLREVRAQVLITGTDVAPALRDAAVQMFHVEQGGVVQQ